MFNYTAVPVKHHKPGCASVWKRILCNLLLRQLKIKITCIQLTLILLVRHKTLFLKSMYPAFLVSYPCGPCKLEHHGLLTLVSFYMIIEIFAIKYWRI